MAQVCVFVHVCVRIIHLAKSFCICYFFLWVIGCGCALSVRVCVFYVLFFFFHTSTLPSPVPSPRTGSSDYLPPPEEDSHPTRVVRINYTHPPVFPPQRLHESHFSGPSQASSLSLCLPPSFLPSRLHTSTPLLSTIRGLSRASCQDPRIIPLLFTAYGRKTAQGDKSTAMNCRNKLERNEMKEKRRGGKGGGCCCSLAQHGRKKVHSVLEGGKEGREGWRDDERCGEVRGTVKESTSWIRDAGGGGGDSSVCWLDIVVNVSAPPPEPVLIMDSMYWTQVSIINNSNNNNNNDMIIVVHLGITGLFEGEIIDRRPFTFGCAVSQRGWYAGPLVSIRIINTTLCARAEPWRGTRAHNISHIKRLTAFNGSNSRFYTLGGVSLLYQGVCERLSKKTKHLKLLEQIWRVYLPWWIMENEKQCRT